MGIKDRINQAKDAAKEKISEAVDKRAEAKEERAAVLEAEGVLWQGKSHESGRNSTVILYRDRIERVKEKAFGSIGRAHQDTEVTPVRAVSSVQAKKDGLTYTKVTVFASGNTIDFRIPHAEAQRFKDELMNLVLNRDAPTSPPAQSTPDAIDQVKRLAELRDQGILSPEEFEAKKKDLLGL